MKTPIAVALAIVLLGGAVAALLLLGADPDTSAPATEGAPPPATEPGPVAPAPLSPDEDEPAPTPPPPAETPAPDEEPEAAPPSPLARTFDALAYELVVLDELGQAPPSLAHLEPPSDEALLEGWRQEQVERLQAARRKLVEQQTERFDRVERVRAPDLRKAEALLQRELELRSDALERLQAGGIDREGFKAEVKAAREETVQQLTGMIGAEKTAQVLGLKQPPQERTLFPRRAR